MINALKQLALNPQYLPRADASKSTITTVIQYVLMVAGSIALLIIVIGAFQYTISRGDPAATAKARNTIIYAIVGLVITMTAYSIVTFVLGRL